MIDIEQINKRKEVIEKDIESVRARVAEYDKKKSEDVALLNALMGAFQQCDAFIKELDDDTPPEEASDVENSSEED
jgi:hypothetical protein|tara:strand:+ start:256 stop:483 length:228 start_codon:yes stop_codon:yes gene_type:complete